MTVITIPKEHRNETRLIAVTPRRYKRLLEIEKKPVLRRSRAAKKTAYNADESIKRALADAKAGRVYGPFKTAEELFAHLDRKS